MNICSQVSQCPIFGEMLQSYRIVLHKSLTALLTSKVTSPQPELDYTKFQHGCFLHRGVSSVSCALIFSPSFIVGRTRSSFSNRTRGRRRRWTDNRKQADLNNSAARKGVSAALVSRFKIPHLFTLISFTGSPENSFFDWGP